jgi:hypothetical protein
MARVLRAALVTALVLGGYVVTTAAYWTVLALV